MTSQNAELAKVKSRIKLFLDRTPENGFTEAESMAAMQKIGQLLSAYNLEITDIDLQSEEYVHHIVNIEGTTQITPVGNVLVTLAAFCDCRVWMDRKPNTAYHLFGMESDVAMAVYLTEMLENMFARAAEEFKTTSFYLNYEGAKRTASTNFLRGIRRRVSSRLRDLNEEKVCEAEKHAIKLSAIAGNGVNLPTIIEKKIALVDEEYKREFMTKKVPTAKRGQSFKNLDYESFHHGVKAGDKINLNRPIEGRNNETLLLG